MNITTIDQGPISIVTVSGSIAHEEIATIRNRLADLIESKKPRIVLEKQRMQAQRRFQACECKRSHQKPVRYNLAGEKNRYLY
jgi:dsRNA-specific ribonuclease